MLIEEREREFEVLLPWRDYFKRLKKKSLRKGSEERRKENRETGRRGKVVHRSSG